MLPALRASPSPSELEVSGTFNADSSTHLMLLMVLERVSLRETQLIALILPTDVPKPTAVGLPYEDVTLTTPDGVKLKAYVIPVRRHFISTHDMQTMSSKERKERTEKEVEVWAQEMGKEDALEVGQLDGAGLMAVCAKQAHGCYLSCECG